MLDTVPKLSQFEAQCLMMDTYETVMGIFNHAPGPHKHARPLAAIALHPSESHLGIRGVNTLIEIFINKDIHKYGITLSEFLDLPHEQITKLIDVVDRKASRESEQIDNVKHMLEAAGRNQRYGDK